MLKIRLEKASNGIIYQVLSMPEQLRHMATFVATTDYRIASLYFPSIKYGDNTIFIRGKDRHHDNDVVIMELTETDDIDRIHDDILATFQEFAESAEYQRLITPVVSPKLVFDNIISYDNDNFVVRLEKAEQHLIFQILKQPDQLRQLGTFVTSSFDIRASSSPLITNSTIFIRGAASEKDESVVVFDCTDNSIRDILYRNVCTSLKELVESPTYQQLVYPTIPDNNVYTF